MELAVWGLLGSVALFIDFQHNKSSGFDSTPHAHLQGFHGSSKSFLVFQKEDYRRDDLPAVNILLGLSSASSYQVI